MAKAQVQIIKKIHTLPSMGPTGQASPMNLAGPPTLEGEKAVDVTLIPAGNQYASFKEDVDPNDRYKGFRFPPNSQEEVKSYIEYLENKYDVVGDVLEQKVSLLPPEIDTGVSKVKRKIIPDTLMSERDIAPDRSAENRPPSRYELLQNSKTQMSEAFRNDPGLSNREERAYALLSNLEKIKLSGLAGYSKVASPGATFLGAEDDKPYQGPHNHEIRFCRDRSDIDGYFDGYGSKSDARCSAIDIVVGRFPEKFTTVEDETGKKTKEELMSLVDFKDDAARIYISQRCDIDRYFLPKSFYRSIPTSERSIARSGIAIKADDIRIISRGGPLRIGTIGSQVKTSAGGRDDFKHGVHLIGGMNSTSNKNLQPMVLGKNLVEAVNKIIKLLGKTHACISNMWQHQMMMNLELMMHFHASPFFGIPTMPPSNLSNMIKPVVSLYSETGQNLVLARTSIETSLLPYLNEGGKYICSPHHKIN